jgi:hypothetical protein
MNKIGLCWLSNKKFSGVNIFSSAALWALWKLRNNVCFQNIPWKNMECLLMNVVTLTHNWQILCPPEKKIELAAIIKELSHRARSLELLKMCEETAHCCA